MKVNFSMKYLISCCLLFVYLGLCGQNGFPSDSTVIEYRAFDQENIAKYTSQKTYNYDLDPKYEENPIRKWWYQLWRNLYDKLGSKTLNITWEILKYGLIIGGVSILAWFLLGSSKSNIFKRSDKSPDFHGALIKSESGGNDIEKLIQEAEDQENFSLATSFLFLKTLRLLDRQKIIEWRDYKTNVAYETEITDLQIKDYFRDLSSRFEYVVYGDFEINQHQYTSLKNAFLGFFNHFHKVKA